MRLKTEKLTEITLLIFCLFVSVVSAYVYQQTTLTTTQNILEITTINLKIGDLGDINEGQTTLYTKSEIPSLEAAATITTTNAPVYLHVTSNLDSLVDSYTTFNINILYDSIPSGGHGSGTAGTLSLTSHDLTTPVTLDVAGTWVFDLSIETTADSVYVNTPNSVSILVEAKSTT